MHKALKCMQQSIGDLRAAKFFITVKKIVHSPDQETSVYEIIIRSGDAESKMKNISIMFHKLGFASMTDPSIMSDEPEVQEKKKDHHLELLSPSGFLKKHTPSNLDVCTREISRLPVKKMHLKPKDVVECKVTNAVSPNEIWVMDIQDKENYYQQ